MRVVSGSLGGRQFDSPKKKLTHPMSEKMRGAIFSVLGDIEGLSILDVFSGSGSLAIEAYSRGANRIIAIEADKNACQTIINNLSSLGINNDSVKVVNARIEGWLNTTNDTFDLVFADPPYKTANSQVAERLIRRLNKDGVMVLSWPGNKELPAIGTLIKAMDYGDSRLGFFKLN